MEIILKTITSMGLRLLSEKVLEELFMWILDKLVKSSNTKYDDELLDMVKRHLDHNPKG